MPDEAAQGSKRASFSRPPAAPKEVRSQLESYQPFASGDPDELVAKVTAENPDLGVLLAAPDKEARVEILARMSWPSRQAAYMSLIAFAFHYEKRSQHVESLRMERIRFEVAVSDSEHLLDSFLGQTYARNVGDTISSIGGVQEQMGDYSLALASCLDAEEWYQQDEALRKEAGITKLSDFDRVFHGEDFRSLHFTQIAGLYKRLGDVDAAGEYNAKAWQYSQRGAHTEDRYEKLIAAAAGAQVRGDSDTALGAYWEALDLALQLPSSSTTGKDVVEALSGAAAIYQNLGLGRRALDLFQRSLEINQRGGHLGRMLIDHTYIAEVHVARGEIDAALAAYREALRCCSVAVPEDAGAGLMALIWHDGTERRQFVRLESAWRILLAVAKLVRGEKKESALENLALAVRVLESLRVRVVEAERRLSYQAAAVDVYDQIIDLHAEMYEQTGDSGHLAELFSYIEHAKARVLSEMLADQSIGKPLHTPDELVQREAALLAEIETLQKSLEGAGSALQVIDELDHAQRQLEEVWSAIVASDPDEGPEYVALRKAQPASVTEVQAVLASASDQKVALVNYYVAPKRMLSVCLFSDRPDLHYHSASVDRKEAREWALVNPHDPPSIDLRLPYWTLDFPSITVAPIAEVVKGYDVVCLAPHDLLHSLPLHAFSAQPDGAPLGATSTVSYIPSAALLRFCLRKRRANAGNSLVAGNPDRPDQPAIPHSETEAAAVAALLGTKALTGAGMTRAVVVEKCGAAEYIHLACHCKFSQSDPLDSALMLSDGDLTARDILGLRINPDLCVLSACESGISKLEAGDELIGLVRALLFAGAPAVVVSLWNAYDTRTAEIMQEFYSERVRNRNPKSTALAEALRSQIRRGTSAAQWAPFVLIGDWR